MANLNDLQTAASRFGVVAGFGTLVPTGQADGQTVHAVQNSLAWIRDHVQGEADTASQLAAQITDASALQNSAIVGGLTTYLNQIADSNGIGGSNFDFAPTAPGITSFKQAWGAVPVWAKIGLGLSLAVGVFVLGHAIARRRTAHALHGLGYEDMAGMFGWN